MALDLIGDKWTLVLVRHLLPGPVGFQHLRVRTGITARVLSARLRQLAAKGLVETVAGEGGRSLYAVTDAGRELAPIAGCTGCHDPPKGDIVISSIRFNHDEMVRRGVACQTCHLNVVEGAGEAPRERCLTCHNQPEKIQRYPETPVIHAAHVAAHTIECTRCHTAIRHRLPPPIRVPAAADRPGPAVVAPRRSP